MTMPRPKGITDSITLRSTRIAGRSGSSKILESQDSAGTRDELSVSRSSSGNEVDRMRYCPFKSVAVNMGPHEISSASTRRR